MDGPSGGGGGDNRGSGGGWQGQKYDATNQIKQFLGVPMEEDERPVVDEIQRTPPQIIPRQRQAHLVNEHLNRSGSPSNRHQRMDSHRYHDGRHHVDGFDTHGRNQPRHYDMNRTLPHRYNEIRHRQDSFDNLNRGHHRMGHDRGYNSNFHNHYNMRDSKDQKDMRPNGPRHLNASGCGPGGMVSDTEAPDFPPSPEVLAELEEEFVYPLKKKSLKFPKAKFFCRLCDYHCDSLLVCGRHVMDSRHRKLKEAKNVDTSLKNMPVPTDVHVTVIDRLVRSVAEELQVSPQMMEQRKEVVAQLNDLLTSKVEGCHLEMVGSSLSGFCLKTSDINIDILMVDNLNPSTALLAVRELVGSSSSELFKDVVDDLSSSYPTMAFTHAKTGLRMVVGACSPSSRLTNQLLADYAAMDPRVKLLGIAFRYWAQLCQIDIQARGTLPPHVFPLMVVHFLQQHEPPVIPVLHMLQDNSESDGYLSPARAKEVWQTKNTQSIGKLWLEMFQFYTVGFKATEHIINVRQFKPMTRAEKTWNKKIAVEDPFLQKRNLTRTVSGNPVFEYIIDRFKSTYRYFAIPQLSFGPLFQHIAVKESRTNSGSSASIAGVAQKNKKGDVLLESLEKVGHSQSEESSECEMEKTDDDLDVTVEGEELDDEEDPASFSCGEPDLSLLAIEDTSNEDSGLTLSANGIISPEEEQFQLDKLTAPVPLLTPSQAAKLMAQVLEQQFVYKFDGKIFKTGVDPPLICRSCQKDGHSKAECREDELPPLNPLPPMKPYFINQLTEIFEHLMKDFEPTLEEIEERDQIVADLEFYIRQFFRGVTLKLFGSSANGFGFQRSDLDICLTFEGNPTGKGIDYIKVIASLAEKLKKYRQCSHVFAITTAKVPIVKFSIRRPALEGDLSLYNTLALQNTKLLATYAKIDNRVKCLGYGMKYFAKLCDIGDASRGSLSSYAYILMVLHFLQQCKPPVIPVLQELYDHSKPAPQLIIDNWNAWFYSDLKSLPKVWKGYRRNKESVGQLWVSMLRYYTETFNWKENVVTIRQHAPLTRLQKLWNSRCIVIEDPFDLSHNLGAGLSRKMNTFIMKAFIKGREVFGSPINFHPQNYKHLVDYLFDTRNLTDGAPPNDRGCRFCGKIGHIQKDCPKRKLNIERKEKRKQQKERQEQRSSALETKREETHKPDLKYVEDSRVREKSRVDSGPKGNLPASAKHPEDVSCGQPLSQPSSKLDHTSKECTRKAEFPQHGKTSHNSSITLPSSSLQSNMMSDGSGKSLALVTENSKSSLKAVDSNSGVIGAHSRTNNSGNNIPSALGTRMINGPVVSDSGLSVVRGVLSSEKGGDSSVLGDAVTKEKPIVGSTSGVDGVAGLSVPPGFHHLRQEGQNFANQPQAVKESTGLGMNSNQSMTGNKKISSHAPNQESVHPLSNSQHHALQLERQHIQSQSQHHIPHHKPQKYVDSWPHVISHQYVNPNPQESVKKNLIHQTATAATSAQNSQPQQQQYYYSITPAALFHMASQAAGGQLSAVLMPNTNESNSNRTGSSIPTSSTGTPNSSISAPPPPPPGFTAPVTINYPNQQLDAAMPFNKLVMGSPLYRSPVSQAEGQQVVPSTASQSFITPLGQSVGGMPGVYALQHSSSGSQFPTINPTGAAHSPQGLNDQNVNQQQVTFDSRQFLSQVPQGLHQGMQGVPQNLTPIPPGISQGVAQTLPQQLQGAPAAPPGLSTSVPQGVQGVSQGLHQSLVGGVPQVSMGQALSPGLQPMPIGHHIPQHYPHPSFPQQGYQMAVPGPGAYYPEFVFSDPSIQTPSPGTQGELIQDMSAFQRPDVYDTQMPALPQYLASSLPQHQNLLSPSLTNISLAPQHGPPTAAGPGPAYTPSSVIFIEGERDGSQILQ